MVTQGTYLKCMYMVTNKKHVNSHTCMVISLYIQTSVGNNGHLQVVSVYGN